MDSELQKTHDSHGHHYDEHGDALPHATGHDQNEDEHPEKKSMMMKFKEKAKKLKNKITGHGHDDEDDEDDEDDDDDETVENSDVHGDGAPMYDSARVGQLGGPDAISSHQRHNLEKPSVKADDQYAVTKPLSSHGPTPPVSTGAYGANLSEPSGNLGLGLGHHQTSGHEVNPDKWRGKVGQPTGTEEDPFAHNPTRVHTPIHATGPTHGMEHVSSDPVSGHGHQGHDARKGELKSDLGKSTGHQGHDAHKGELKSDLGKSTGHQGHDAHEGELKSDLQKSTGHQGHDAHEGELKSDFGKSTGHQGHDAHMGELKSDLGKSTGHQGHDAHEGELKSDLGKSTGHQGHDAHEGELKSDFGKSTGHQGHDAHEGELKSDFGKSTGHQGHDAHMGELKSDLGKSTGHQGHDAHVGELKSDFGKSTGHQGHDAHEGELKSDFGKSTGHQVHDAHEGELKSDFGKSTGHQGHDAHMGELKSDFGKSTGHQGHDAHEGELKSDFGKSTGHQGHDAHMGELKSDFGKSTGHQGHDAHMGELKSDFGKSTGHQGHDAHKGELKSDLGMSTGHQGHDAYKGELKSDLGKSTGHQGHDAHKGELKGVIGKSTATDPRAPKDPSRLGSHPLNYESKVADPTHTGGKEVDSSKMQHSFENMGIGSNPKSYDPNHPENLPHDTLAGIGSNRKSYDPNHPEKLPQETLTGNQSSKSSSYTEKISSSDKAAAAKDDIASKLGYSGQNQPTGSPETDKNTGSMTGSGTETVPLQVHHGGSGAVAMDEGKETDKGVFAKEYLVETSRPGDEDKALSDVISHALHRGHEEESEKKPGQDGPMGKVTESAEDRRRLGTDRHEEHQQQQHSGDVSADKSVRESERHEEESEKKPGQDRPMGKVTESAKDRRRLGTDRHEEHQQQQHSGDVSADKSVSERLMDAVGLGSWFGGTGDAPQGTLGTSNVTDQGLSSNPRGDQKS